MPYSARGQASFERPIAGGTLAGVVHRWLSPQPEAVIEIRAAIH